MKRDDILRWLRETDPAVLAVLWEEADRVRRQNVGDGVHLRGLIEFGNVCRRNCGYCGLRADNRSVQRYRLSAEEILECANQARRLGYGTVVLQSGEDPGMPAEWLAEVVRQIKRQCAGMAVTLSVGERDVGDYAQWRQAGADRYLLRFETSNRELYDKIHPPVAGRRSDRFELLAALRDLGYEVGSGIMLGIPGQTWEDVAVDLEWFRRLDLDMIGVGTFIAHPQTPLGAVDNAGPWAVAGQVTANEETTCKTVALARLLCPRANIPSTSALATLNPAQGRELGLCRGANVVMPNLTPLKYRALYEIYPAKACINETAEDCAGCMRRRIESIGRVVASGPGTSLNWLARRTRSGSHERSEQCRNCRS
jgi:biotin synthase